MLCVLPAAPDWGMRFSNNFGSTPANSIIVHVLATLQAPFLEDYHPTESHLFVHLQLDLFDITVLRFKDQIVLCHWAAKGKGNTRIAYIQCVRYRLEDYVLAKTNS